MRAVPEWRGKHDDSPIPKAVKNRIWLRTGGRCHLTKRKIQVGDTYEFDHIKALCNGGEHREFNIAPALTAPHKIKTAADRSEKQKTDRLRAKHNGYWPEPVRKLQGRGFGGSRKSSAEQTPTKSPG